MTVEATRARTAAALHAHQPDPHATTAAEAACTCGEKLPGHRAHDALAVHQSFELAARDFLRADPTGPLSLHSLAVLEPGEVVFDTDGIAWMCTTRQAPGTATSVWATFDDRAGRTLICAEDLHAERSPLSLYREPARAPFTQEVQ